MTNELERFLLAKQDLKCRKCHSRFDVNSLIKCEIVLRNTSQYITHNCHLYHIARELHTNYSLCALEDKKVGFLNEGKNDTGKKHSDVFIYSRGIILSKTVFSSALLIKWQFSLENKTMENTVSLKPVALFIKPTFFF